MACVLEFCQPNALPTTKAILGNLPGGFSTLLSWRVLEVVKRPRRHFSPDCCAEQRRRACLRRSSFVPGAVRDILPVFRHASYPPQASSHSRWNLGLSRQSSAFTLMMSLCLPPDVFPR